MVNIGAFGRAAFGADAVTTPPPPEDLNIIVPDPNLMSNLAAEEKKKDFLKYGAIALLAAITGYILGREYTKSPAMTAAVSGLGALVLVVGGDYFRNKI